MNTVTVLFDGYSFMKADSPHTMIANCTCTLVESGHTRIIVDTMTPWDKETLESELLRRKLSPQDFQYVVSTHGHSDHLGNNNLFLNARHIVGQNISSRNEYLLHDFAQPFRINDDIEIVKTPGHTNGCVSLIVRNTNLGGTVAIVGDLFERVEDIEEPALWQDAGSESPELQRKNRLDIANAVDVIVPGHGPLFRVTAQMRQQLAQCLLSAK